MKPLDNWLHEEYDIDSRLQLDEYIEKKLKEQIEYARNNSVWYKRTLSDISRWEDIPYLTSDDVIKSADSMLCIRDSAISRIVTSGTTGTPKRVYFSEKDLKQIKDFFSNGMKYMTEKGDIAYISFSGSNQGMLVSLLTEALALIGVKTENRISKETTCIIGSPEEVLKLSEEYDIGPRSVLLSSSYVSDETRRKIEKNWKCKVYEHYGMTEMGLGGAVSCGDKGYHIRENDIYIEIIDSKTGKILPDGQWGEIVYTSLNREAMPFIRYRTGDISRIIKETCSCGSMIKRLDKVKERENG